MKKALVTTALLIGFVGIVWAKTNKEISRENLKDLEESIKHKKLRTFQEAIRDVSDKDKKPAMDHVINFPPPPKNKIFFEVVRVNERVVVDENKVTKGYTANVHNALYTLESGHLRRLFVSDMRVKPKPDSPLLRAIKAHQFLDEPIAHPPTTSEKFKQWFDQLARKLHLDEFWPRLLASIILGFAATLVLYLFAYGAMLAFSAITGYKPVCDDDEEQQQQMRTGSEENLLKKEQSRMEVIPPKA